MNTEAPREAADIEQVEPTGGLLGDLGRGKLEEQGVQLELFAIHDFWANVAGGDHRGGGVIGAMNVILSLDTSKLGMWDGGEFVFWGIGVYGRRPSDAVGDFQYTSSYDGPDTVEPYEMYYKHSFADGAIDLLAGVHDFSLDFATLDYGYALINSSFFTPPTITQIPYSFYPNTGFGTRISAHLTEGAYLLAGLYDGQPAGISNMRDKTWEISAREGIYSIAEIVWRETGEDNHHMKVALGGWSSSGTYDDVNGVERSSNSGSYFIAERQLWREGTVGEQGLGVFAQVGHAQADRNFNPWYFGGGIRYEGLFERRDEDILSFGYARANASSRYRSLNEETPASEQVFELCYRARVAPDITLSPDVQFILDPLLSPDATDALIFYVRTEVAL
jgi:porin